MTDATALQIEKIALFLGNPWKVSRLREPSTYSYEIIDGKGRELFFRVEKGKFKVMGCFPRNRCEAHHNDHLSIGVSINRPAQEIAADIKRRLLPHYLERFPKTVKRFQENKAKEEHILFLTQALHRVAGGWINDRGRGAKTVYFDNGEAEIWNSEKIDLKLRDLTPEQAMQIIAIANPTNE